MQQITQGQVLRQLRVAGLAVTETLHTGGLKLATHDHDHANINIVVDGALNERVERHVFDCGPGSMLLKPPGARHSNDYIQERSTRCIVVEFEPRFDIERRSLLNHVRFAANLHIAHLTSELQRELNQPAPSLLIVEGTALTLLGHLTDTRCQERRFPNWLLRVRDLLEGSNGAMTLEEIASHVGVDRTHLHRTFRQYYRVSPGEYVRRRRIETAAALLRSSKQSLADIAISTGFADQSHLTRIFRRQLGITPSEYRRRNRA
jgi:AraC family transcriptional regulator